MRLHRKRKSGEAAAAAAASMRKGGGGGGAAAIPFLERNDDIFYEILKHLDAKALAVVSCVNRRWRVVADDETLWEMVCTRDWPKSSSSSRAGTLRSVVIALGGFKRLYALCLRPLLSRPMIEIPSGSAPSVSASSKSSTIVKNKQWSKDEVHLSLSLFSIDCYERLGKRYNCKAFNQLHVSSPSMVHCAFRSSPPSIS